MENPKLLGREMTLVEHDGQPWYYLCEVTKAMFSLGGKEISEAPAAPPVILDEKDRIIEALQKENDELKADLAAAEHHIAEIEAALAEAEKAKG